MATAPQRPKSAPTAGPAEPDLRLAEELLMALLSLPGGSCHEAEVLHFVRGKLVEAGVPESSLTWDQAHRRSPAGGEIGNLICKDDDYADTCRCAFVPFVTSPFTVRIVNHGNAADGFLMETN